MPMTNGYMQPWSATYGHLCNPCNYMDYYYSFTDPEAMEG